MLKHKLVNRYSIEVIKTNEVNFIYKYFAEWYDLFIEYREMKEQIAWAK